ncbi:MAG: D-alanyl-D-alanine carboxypeptidase family protein [Tumebacillaceae bacterium]
MKKFRHLLLTLCVTVGLITTSISQTFASNDTPSATDITAKGAVLIDMQSGQILYEKNKDMHLYPASITKIMTAILALENGSLTDEITTSELARDQEGNRVYLEVGEKEPLEKMLYGLLLNSGNDAAIAIAEQYGGSVAGFAKMMNKKAVELGAVNTHFTNPNGLHDDNHYTTAYDMALIANYAMKNAKFREIVSTKTYAWHGEKWDSNLVNLNSMLWDYDGATGVKTGFTDQAEQTIVTSAKRGNHELLTVLMYAPTRPVIHEQAAKLLDYGFAHFSTQKIASSGDVITTFDAEGNKVQAKIAHDIYNTFPNGTKPVIKPVVHLDIPSAPFYKGFKVGTVDFTADGQTFTTADLISSSDVLPPPPPLLSKKSLWSNKYLLLGIGLFLVVIGTIVRRLRKVRKINPIDSHLYET